jgi:hypothetical protein
LKAPSRTHTETNPGKFALWLEVLEELLSLGAFEGGERRNFEHKNNKKTIQKNQKREEKVELCRVHDSCIGIILF